MNVSSAPNVEPLAHVRDELAKLSGADLTAVDLVDGVIDVPGLVAPIEPTTQFVVPCAQRRDATDERTLNSTGKEHPEMKDQLDIQVRTDSELAVERHDVFDVLQVTRDTDLEADVGVDLVGMEPGLISQIHRHNLAETVLYFLEGTGHVDIEDVLHPAAAGDRIRIGRGEFHGVRSGRDGCKFLSVQTPPILNKTTGFRDLEHRAD